MGTRVRRDGVRKLGPFSFVSALLVMSMMLASMAFLPAGPVSAVPSGMHVTVEVRDADGYLVGATVVMSDPYGRTASVVGLTSTDGNATFASVPGMYQLKVTAANHYDYQLPAPIRVDGLHNNHTLITLDKLGTTGMVTFNLMSGGKAVIDPSITLYSTGHGAATTTFSAQGTSGNVTLIAPAGSYKMVAKSAGYLTNVTNVTVSTPPSRLNINLNATTYVNYTVKVTSANGALVDLRGFLVLKNGSGLDPEARIIDGRTYGQYVTFNATHGIYILFVAAENARTYESEVNITGPGQTIPMASRSVTSFTTTMTFATNDWNVLSINESHGLAFNTTVPGLPFSYIPSIRMQAELAYGNGDGMLNSTEAQKFVRAIASLGPYWVYTDGLVQVNSESYLSVAGNPTVLMNGLIGPVNSTSAVTMSIIDDYAINGPQIPLGGSSYGVNVDLQYNNPNATHSYRVAPPLNQEVSGVSPATGKSATVTSPSGLRVSGYFNISIASIMKSTGDPDVPFVSVIYQHTAAPTAEGSVAGPASYYYLVSVNATYSYYIVANDSEMIFSASGSYDPNLNPLTYLWNFGDGSTSSTSSARHTFTQATLFRNVSLTVRDVSNLSSTIMIDVKVDDQKPIPVISVNGETTSTFYAVQKQTLTFGEASTVDYITGPSDPVQGVIRQYRWSFGDGSNPVTVTPPSLQNVTHAFSKAGMFTVWLNVTDGVGHLGSRSMSVVVNDTQAPIAKMTVENASGLVGTTAQERTVLTFNASGSTDNSGSVASFHWDFGDGASDDGVVVNHSFATAGTYKVVLVATDANGNAGNISRTLTITYGPRPDLRALSIVIDPASYAVGDRVTIRLNLINMGPANATDVYVVYYLIDLAGNRQEIGNSSQLFVNGSAADHLSPGESGYVALTCSFASEGSYNLEADVHSFDEVNIVDNIAKQSLSVNAGGSVLLLAAIVVALIVIVAVVLVAFRRRIFKALKK